MDDGDALLTAQEAADFLGVSRATLYAYVSRGLVASEPSDRPGRARRYRRSSLERLKARRAERRDPAGGALAGGAPILESSLTLIENGRLFYRGQDACELSRTATLEEVAALLWAGSRDVADDLFPRRTLRRAARQASLADRLVRCLVAERARQPLTLSPAGPATWRAAGRTISALFDAAGAAGEGRLAERLARGWGAQRVGELEAALILCADHELNTSAFTARCVASTDAPIPSALLAAFCALEGRRHGGASREIDDLLDDVERVGGDAALTRALARRGRVPGLGDAHPLYPTGDPRAIELLGRLDLADDEPAAQAIHFAERHGGSPSIEMALAALARREHLPDDAAFVLFALGRSVGWVAHALEAAEAGRLIRPRARYVGPLPTPP